MDGESVKGEVIKQVKQQYAMANAKELIDVSPPVNARGRLPV